MKPSVAVFGWPMCYPIVYDVTVCAACAFDFHFMGGCGDFIALQPNAIETLGDNHDAIILHSAGYPPSYMVADFAKALVGRRAKVAVWSMDSHNSGWSAWERNFNGMFDAWFTAHSEWIPEIGDKTLWMPCYLPTTAGYADSVRPPSVFDVSLVGEPYPARDVVLKRMAGYMDGLGLKHSIGTFGKADIPNRYRESRCVLNVNQNTDLNLRQFEALGVGTPTLMTPAFDWSHPMFDDLRPYAVTVPRDADAATFKECVQRATAIDATPARAIVMAKHQLIHRYISICEAIL